MWCRSPTGALTPASSNTPCTSTPTPAAGGGPDPADSLARLHRGRGRLDGAVRHLPEERRQSRPAPAGRVPHHRHPRTDRPPPWSMAGRCPRRAPQSQRGLSATAAMGGRSRKRPVARVLREPRRRSHFRRSRFAELLSKLWCSARRFLQVLILRNHSGAAELRALHPSRSPPRLFVSRPHPFMGPLGSEAPVPDRDQPTLLRRQLRGRPDPGFDGTTAVG